MTKMRVPPSDRLRTSGQILSGYRNSLASNGIKLGSCARISNVERERKVANFKLGRQIKKEVNLFVKFIGQIC